MFFLQHIVIVITDGESNVQHDMTLPRAQDLHENGIEVKMETNLHTYNRIVLDISEGH